MQTETKLINYAQFRDMDFPDDDQTAQYELTPSGYLVAFSAAASGEVGSKCLSGFRLSLSDLFV